MFLYLVISELAMLTSDDFSCVQIFYFYSHWNLSYSPNYLKKHIVLIIKLFSKKPRKIQLRNTP